LLAAAGLAFAFVRGTSRNPPAAPGGIDEASAIETLLDAGSRGGAAAVPPAEPDRCPDEHPPPALEPPPKVEPAVATADYRFTGTLASSVGVAPDLVEIGPGTSGFSDEGMIGRAVLSLGGGRGLSLTPTTGVIGRGEYTIELLFRFDRLDGYRKILDFKDGSDDSGLYVLDGCLNFFPRRPRSSTAIEADRYVQVVLTRDPSARVVAYVDGVRQFTFRDRLGFAELDASETLRFFADDSVTGGEYSSGAVSQIRLYDRPLTAAEVAALACAELRVPLATRPC
jgi:hypothetical protein